MSSSTDIQRELEQTRSRMSAELDALAYKLDGPSRVKERVTGAASKVRSATPSGDDVKGTAYDNPLGVVLGGVAAGVLAGLFLPRTKVEDEKVGPIAARVRDEVVSTGREALQRGKSVARQAGEAAKEAAADATEKQGAIEQTTGRRAKKVTNSARSRLLPICMSRPSGSWRLMAFVAATPAATHALGRSRTDGASALTCDNALPRIAVDVPKRPLSIRGLRDLKCCAQ